MNSCLLSILLALSLATASAQTTPTLAFDVASVRQNKTGYAPTGDMPSTNVPLGPGTTYTPTGGLLSIRNLPFQNLVNFAYTLTNGQGDTLHVTLPAWARDNNFDVQARTDKPNVTKDELRLMMRSLLADRFGLVVHYESRVTSVFAVQLVKPGTLGPTLRPHPAGSDCPRATPAVTRDGPSPPPELIDGGFPTLCGGLVMMSSSTPTHFRIGARDVPFTLIANSMPNWGDLGRPIVNQTALTGTYDFALEYVPKHPDPPPGQPAPAEQEEPNFLEAVRKQLGLKLEPQKQEVQILVLDHIAPLTDN